MTDCPNCSSPLYEYHEEGWLVLICWECGRYEDNSPGYKALPDLFKNMVCENPKHFIKKYLLGVSDESLQGSKTDEDFTEP